jgi:uracil-DNA glycosylase family 4
MQPKQDALKNSCKNLGLRYVGGRGNPKSGLFIAGEAPGADEDQRGIPFCGSSGKEQDRMLIEAGFSFGTPEAYFTNPYRVRPPDNDLSRLPELGIPPADFEAAFIEELFESKPAVIVAAGLTSLRILIPDTRMRSNDTGISRWRGSLMVSPLLPWPHYIIPVQHPAFILSHSWPDRPVSVLCYQRALEEWRWWLSHGKNEMQPLPERSLYYDPTYDDVIAYLNDLLNDPVIGVTEPISSDIETYKRKFVYLLALAKSATDGISIGLWDYMEQPDGKAKTIRIFRLLDRIFRTRQQVGQNYTIFDAHWLETLGFEFSNPSLIQDTLFRHHVLYPELEHSLQFQTMQFTRQPYYKDEGKLVNIKKPEDRKRFKRYNALDACVTREIFDRQEEEFNS